MAASKQLYGMVAQSIQWTLEDFPEHRRAIQAIVGWLCIDFAADNPHFKRETFINACGFNINQIDGIDVTKEGVND